MAMVAKCNFVLLIFGVAVVVVVVVVGQPLSIGGTGVCRCHTAFTRTLCGTELNRMDAQNNCSRDQYLCGPSNRNDEAVMVKRCRQGSECDRISASYRNPCTADIDCHCPRSLQLHHGERRHCGDRLTGNDCNRNVVYTCGRGFPVFVDACPAGCQHGRCVAISV